MKHNNNSNSDIPSQLKVQLLSVLFRNFNLVSKYHVMSYHTSSLTSTKSVVQWYSSHLPDRHRVQILLQHLEVRHFAIGIGFKSYYSI